MYNSMFHFLRDYQTVFQSGCVILHSHQQCVRAPIGAFFPALVVVCLLIIVILWGVTWYLILVLVCVSLMTNDVAHLLMCVLAICVSFLDKCRFRSFAHF